MNASLALAMLALGHMGRAPLHSEASRPDDRPALSAPTAAAANAPQAEPPQASAVQLTISDLARRFLRERK